MKIKKKGFVSLLLCMLLILTVVVQPTAAHAEGEEKAAVEKESIVYDSSLNMKDYRGTNMKAPEKPGYVFAGWYKADSTNSEFGGYSPLTEAEANDATSAYAKFVDEKVLRVKFQLRAGTTSEDESTALRMLTTVDSLAYDSVGFVIEFNGKKVVRNSKTVYETILGYTSDGVSSYTPSEAFGCEISKYFLSLNITNIPAKWFEEKFKITPIWTTLDGTVVTGSAREITVKEGYANIRDERSKEYTGGAEIYEDFSKDVPMADLSGKALQFEFKFTSETGKFGFALMANDWTNITGTIVIEKKDGKIVSNIGKIVETGNGWYAWKLNCDQFAEEGAAIAKEVGLAYHNNGIGGINTQVEGTVYIDWDSMCAANAYTE